MGPTAQDDDGDKRRRLDQVAVVQVYSLTLPGLDVRSDWRLVHDRLLDEFLAIDDVLPTTTTATILIVYEGPAPRRLARLDR